ASDKDDPTEDERFGRVGRQVVKDTGPLTTKRMPNVDQEFVDATVDFMKRAKDKDKPFFIWFNPSRMHMFTHVPNEWKGKSGLNFYADGMLQHDDHVGQLLNTLDKMGIADNTIVVYTSDNGPHSASWPDAGVSWFRSEKVTNWEGAFRVPMLVRWPAKIPAGSISNEIMAHLDWVPTLMAAAGDTNIKEKLKKGYSANGKTYKNHLDGYNFLPHL
ncbi:MAG: sulfatase-like hydrolase/transferase, partial [Gammaproteobacteria bacterium]|nr:sulfatase-like hydrolase/transferase [Gammaproteobacteria bacterium]